MRGYRLRLLSGSTVIGFMWVRVPPCVLCFNFSMTKEIMAGYIQQAFDIVCNEAVHVDQSWYVALIEHVPFYGGPEEGGWWGEDTYVVAFQKFIDQEAANNASKKIQELADALTKSAHDEEGKLCLAQMKWLEERFLEADFLPENDGPSQYSVVVSESLPEERRGCRHYE